MSTSPPGKPTSNMPWDSLGHKEEEKARRGTENCFFTDLDEVPFETLLSRERKKKPEEDKMDVEPAAVKAKKLKTIEFIVMVGFHHKVGSQVEYIYPPVQEDKEGNLSAEFLN
jgi:hypothetical protein